MTDWGAHRFGAAMFAIGVHKTGPVEVIPPEIAISQTSAEIYQTEIISLSASVNSPGLELQWISTDPWVANVSNGIVKGLNEGSSVIRVQVAGGAYYAECALNVLPPMIEILSDSVALLEGESLELDFRVGPASSEISWSTADASVATVNNGLLSAQGPGTTWITASILNRYVVDTCRVSVSVIQGLESQEASLIQVYPVPTNGKLVVKSKIRMGQLELLNLQGQVVMQPDLKDEAIHLGGLEDGVYLLRIITPEGEVHIRRLLKQ
jgi:hypothetical protein